MPYKGDALRVSEDIQLQLSDQRALAASSPVGKVFAAFRKGSQQARDSRAESIRNLRSGEGSREDPSP